MPKIKRRTFSGCVCEQEIFTISGRVKNLKTAEPRLRFKTDEERARHRDMQSRRNHTQIFNATFSPQSLYSTLTLDDEHEVHTFEEAWRLGDNYVRRLRYANPNAQIMIYAGRGKGTDRIHFHMVSNGLSEETIRAKWTAGSIGRIKPLRKHNYYKVEGKGLVNHGADYTGLANYLYNHWTPEQGGHRWKQTRNISRPEKETPNVIKRSYTKDKPPRAPKGYMLVETKSTGFGYLYFKYVRKNDMHSSRMKN